MKKFIKIICLLFTFYFLLFTFFATSSFAQEKAEKKLTKKEMIEIINNDLYTYGEEILSMIPNIVKKIDAEGKEIYLFKKASGEEVNFEDLDEETLSSLYRGVRNRANLIWNERLNLQLQQLRQVPMPVQPVTPPPQPPKVHTPPRIPSPPPQQRR